MATAIIPKLGKSAQVAAATNEVGSFTEVLLHIRDLERNATEEEVVDFGRDKRLLL